MQPVDTSSHPLHAGFAAHAAAMPAATGDFARDAGAFTGFWREGAALLAGLARKDRRDAAEAALADGLLAAGRRARHGFLARHSDALYDALTDGRRRFGRVEQLAWEAAARVPGIAPTRAEVDAEDALDQMHKDGHEIDQGILFNHFLGNRDSGLHLVHAMLLPREDALAQRERLARDGRVDLGTATVERHGQVSVVAMRNPRFLNAEDDTTVNAVEAAVDLAILDPATEVCVLKGAAIEGGKYDGQAVFCTGINLTHLYRGRISYLWYLVREMGFINKIYRGLASPETSPDEVFGDTREKPWIAAVEKFAIGGGCQYLLAIDHVVAAADAYLTLPARKEGIIPGVANMRLPRFVGDRAARQLIMNERRLDCDSADGRLICDEVAPAGRAEAAAMAAAEKLATSGVVSASSNRKAFRIAQEPLDLFRSYMAVYAREQAYCHFSPQLIRNLERFWNAQARAA